MIIKYYCRVSFTTEQNEVLWETLTLIGGRPLLILRSNTRLIREQVGASERFITELQMS